MPEHLWTAQGAAVVKVVGNEQGGFVSDLACIRMSKQREGNAFSHVQAYPGYWWASRMLFFFSAPLSCPGT